MDLKIILDQIYMTIGILQGIGENQKMAF